MVVGRDDEQVVDGDEQVEDEKLGAQSYEASIEFFDRRTRGISAISARTSLRSGRHTGARGDFISGCGLRGNADLGTESLSCNSVLNHHHASIWRYTNLSKMQQSCLCS